MACHDRELSILFTDDERIALLNEQYLGRKGATNVLAFPMYEGQDKEIDSPMLGDVVISLDTALRESESSGEPLVERIDRLLIHGVLHLLGYDHERSPSEAERMEGEEERLLGLINE